MEKTLGLSENPRLRAPQMDEGFRTCGFGPVADRRLPGNLFFRTERNKPTSYSAPIKPGSENNSSQKD